MIVDSTGKILVHDAPLPSDLKTPEILKKLLMEI
jgi:hypothetical protein